MFTIALLHNWCVKSVIIVQDPDVLLFEQLDGSLPYSALYDTNRESSRKLTGSPLNLWRKQIKTRIGAALAGTIDWEKWTKHTQVFI